jgi:hypothetical protein
MNSLLLQEILFVPDPFYTFYFHDLFSVKQQGQVNGRNQPLSVATNKNLFVFR